MRMKSSSSSFKMSRLLRPSPSCMNPEMLRGEGIELKSVHYPLLKLPLHLIINDYRMRGVRPRPDSISASRTRRSNAGFEEGSNMFQDVPCNFCSHQDTTVVFDAGVAQLHRIVRCKHCNLLYASPRALEHEHQDE